MTDFSTFSGYHRETMNTFLDRAEKGDGQFAVAYALMQIAQAHDELRRDLCFGKNSGPGVLYPGVLEKIGMDMEAIAKAVTAASDTYTDR